MQKYGTGWKLSRLYGAQFCIAQGNLLSGVASKPKRITLEPDGAPGITSEPMMRSASDPQVELDGPPEPKRTKLSPSNSNDKGRALVKVEPHARAGRSIPQAEDNLDPRSERAVEADAKVPVEPAPGPGSHDPARLDSAQTDAITLQVFPNTTDVPELVATVAEARHQVAHLPPVPAHPVPQVPNPTKATKRPRPPKPPKPANILKVHKAVAPDDDPMKALRPRRNPFSTSIPPHPVFWRNPGIPPVLTALPPPLLIHSLDLRLQSVTHLSYYLNGSKNVRLSKEESYVKCFRPLEWFGDAELKHYVANILVKRFPNLTHASYTLLAAMLIQNDTISYIAWAYGLGDLMLFGKVAHGDESFAHHQDALANLFEAMLGALVKDRGTEGESEIKEWMGKIFSDEVFPELKGRAEAMKEWPLKDKVTAADVDVLPTALVAPISTA